MTEELRVPNSLATGEPLDNEPKAAITVRPTQLLQAVQWFKNGDHPDDECVMLPGIPHEASYQSEGKVVRPFSAGANSDVLCNECKEPIRKHGYIGNPDVVNRIVCPGDWVMSPMKGYYFAFPQKDFAENYEVITEVKP